MKASEPWPVLGKDRLDEAQRALWDELTLGPRGFYCGGPEAERLPDLYNAWLQFPALGQAMLQMGDAVRQASHLPGWARELVVLVTSAWGGAWVEFDFHVPFARNEGLDEALIAALREGREPAFEHQRERVVWAANRELLATMTLAPATRAEVLALLGHEGLMQLIATVMLYTVTAWTTNVARVQLAEDFAVPQERLDAFFAGRRRNRGHARGIEGGMSGHWLVPEREGLRVAPADAWVDPSRPAALALITHGHADHARGGHGEVYATPETLAIMETRYGPPTGRAVAVAYGESVGLPGGVRASFHPAGHVLGSAQICLEHAGERIVVTGDFKRRPDPTCPPFAPVACDVLITEATFGLPVFRHPPIGGEIARLLAARAAGEDRGRCVLVGAYALGKAQRVIAELRRAGYHEPIYLHGALERMCRLYEALGVELGELRLAAGMPKGALEGAIVLSPPSALNDRWSRRLPDPLTAMASGWMRVRQRARQRNVELPLVISDHADWDELTATIAEVDPGETWITHGAEEALLRWCELGQRKARALALVGYDDEDD